MIDVIIPILQVGKRGSPWAPRPSSECMGQRWVWQEEAASLCKYLTRAREASISCSLKKTTAYGPHPARHTFL